MQLIPRGRQRRLFQALAIACCLAIAPPTQAFVPATVAGAAISAAAKWCWNQVVSWQASKVLDRIAGSDHQAQLERSLAEIRQQLSTANAAERDLLYEQMRMVHQSQEMVRRVLQISEVSAGALRKETAAFQVDVERRLQAVEQKIAALEAKDLAHDQKDGEHDAKDAEHDARLDWLERGRGGRPYSGRNMSGCEGGGRRQRVGSQRFLVAGGTSSVVEDWHPRGARITVYLDACNPYDGARGLLIALDLSGVGSYGGLQGSIALGSKVIGLKYSVVDPQPAFFFDYDTLAPGLGQMDFSLKLRQGRQVLFEIPSKRIDCGSQGCRWTH